MSREEDPDYSEFGRGLLVCLLGFLDHKSKIHSWLDGSTAELLGESEAITMWANGARGHLFELEIPDCLKGSDLAVRLETFKSKWLSIGDAWGHELKGLDKTVVYQGLEEAERLALEVAAEMDKILGLKNAKVGEWT